MLPSEDCGGTFILNDLHTASHFTSPNWSFPRCFFIPVEFNAKEKPTKENKAEKRLLDKLRTSSPDLRAGISLSDPDPCLVQQLRTLAPMTPSRNVHVPRGRPHWEASSHGCARTQPVRGRTFTAPASLATNAIINGPWASNWTWLSKSFDPKDSKLTWLYHMPSSERNELTALGRFARELSPAEDAEFMPICLAPATVPKSKVMLVWNRTGVWATFSSAILNYSPDGFLPLPTPFLPPLPLCLTLGRFST